MADRGAIAGAFEIEIMNWDMDKLGHMASLLQKRVDVDVSVNYPLAGLNSWKLGGCADLLVQPHDVQAAEQMFAFLFEHRWPWVVLGSGTNVLIPDTGLSGVVVQLGRLKHIKRLAPGCYNVASGASLRELVRTSTEFGYSGIEDLGAVPGSVGGAVVMNAGAGTQTFGAVVTGIHAVLRGQPIYLDHTELKFDYRSSAVSTQMCILTVDIQLSAGCRETCMERRKQALKYRKKAQRVCLPNAGSVFCNPPGICAWKLIDRCGLRGFCIGGAQVSMQHANFIVNTGNAVAADVTELIAHIQREVYLSCGIHLETEVRFLHLRQDESE